jgi:hypothetical protein
MLKDVSGVTTVAHSNDLIGRSGNNDIDQSSSVVGDLNKQDVFPGSVYITQEGDINGDYVPDLPANFRSPISDAAKKLIGLSSDDVLASDDQVTAFITSKKPEKGILYPLKAIKKVYPDMDHNITDHLLDYPYDNLYIDPEAIVKNSDIVFYQKSPEGKVEIYDDGGYDDFMTPYPSNSWAVPAAVVKEMEKGNNMWWDNMFQNIRNHMRKFLNGQSYDTEQTSAKITVATPADSSAQEEVSPDAIIDYAISNLANVEPSDLDTGDVTGYADNIPTDAHTFPRFTQNINS